MRQANIKNSKYCAFCKHWYDPTNSAIAPKYPKQGMWEYDPKAKKKCLKNNLDKLASSFCSGYESKLG